MKETYIAPMAEKLEFNYAETVVASDQCGTPVYAQDLGPDSGDCFQEGTIAD